MKTTLAQRQFALLIAGSVFILFVLGQLVFMGETDYQSFFVAPIIFSASLIFMLIQKVLNVFAANEKVKQFFFLASITGLLTSTIFTFPFWMFV